MDVPRTQKKSRARWLWIAGGVAVLGTVSAALAGMDPAAPDVERATVWTDTVRRGDMVRQVRGPGTLVAEDIRWIAAMTQGRIERKRVQPGTTVKTGDVLVELSNVDVEREALEAQRQLSSAESDLVALRATLENQRLAQEAAIASVRSQQREADRQVRTNEGLAQAGLIARMDLDRSRDAALELNERLELEQRRLRFMTEAQRGQIAAQERQVTMLRTLAAFQQRQIESMTVRATADGVLQELPVELGQWVMSGATLAKVVQPGRLKAVLRVPETQAKDVAVGQPASIDTRNGIVRGRVVRIDPSVQGGTVAVDVALEGALPRGARPDLSVDGTVDVDRLANVLYVGRPAYGQAESVVGLFKVVDGGRAAVRTPVRLGRGSATTVEILGGLAPGDIVILSDMSAWDASERVRLR